VKKPKLTSSGNIEEFRQKHNKKDVAKPLLGHKEQKEKQDLDYFS
jgi:hypothetical protein